MTGLLILYLEFFKIGLFAIGGGLATLPFLYELANKYPWFTEKMLGDMLAISESTPGPIGINMATYVGFQNYGVIGALFSTIGLVSPSVIVILIVAKFLSKFSQSKAVENVFTTLRPAVTGMLATVALSLIIAEFFNLEVADFTKELFNLKHIILFGFLFILTNKYKKHPLFYIAISAVVGMLFAF